jgi:hypothetical protein
MNSTEIMRNYLQAVGQLPKSLNGPDMAGPAKRRPTQKEVEDLQKLVNDQAATNRIVLFLGLFLILVVFIVALISAIRTGSSVSAILGVAGIGTGVEAGLLTWVLYLWSEYNKFSFLLILSQRLDPEEYTKAILALFLTKKSERKQAKSLAAAAGG